MRNKYGVPVKAWKRWSPEARAVFNEVYWAGFASPRLFCHPKAADVPLNHWKTTAWNFAWEAAAAVDGYQLDHKASAKGDEVVYREVEPGCR